MPPTPAPSAKARSNKVRTRQGQPLAGAELQRRLEEIELATVSAIRALQMDVEGDAGVPSTAVLRKARQAIR